MKTKEFTFLSGLPVFSALPKEDLKTIVENMELVTFPKGEVLWKQGEAPIDTVMVIQKGVLELYHQEGGQRRLTHRMKRGDVFGGITVIMDFQHSPRSAMVKKELWCYRIPKEVFLNLCVRHRKFYEYFIDAFGQRMIDERYSSVIAAAQAAFFLSGIVPFSFLSMEEIDLICSKISFVHYPKDTVLFVHGQSKIDHLYIIKKGAAERYYEQETETILRGMLSEGDMYGGISMLINDGMAVRSLRTTENTFFYLIPEKVFLDVCARHEEFSEFFTDTFGKRMIDKTYSRIVSKYRQPKQDDLSFLGQTINGIFHQGVVSCDSMLPIRDAAVKMSDNKCSSIFVHDENAVFTGVVTDTDLRRKVIARGMDTQLPVAEVMSTPLHTIPANALIIEALMTMMQERVKHLAVTDVKGKVAGVLTNRDLLNAQEQSPLFLIRRIASAEKVEDVLDKHEQLPGLIKALIKSRAKPRNITRMVTAISDAILEKIIDFSIEEIGEPPVRWAFMILGSEGRKEQTLKTDQDNAIIYEDVGKQRDVWVREYFIKLGVRICNYLDRAGYAFCKGGVMAMNPQWCIPYSEWKDQFTKWIYTAEPEALLNSSIFFDFRGIYGDLNLVDDLRTYLTETLEGWPGFFRHLSENALFFKPPIGFFRNFLVESKGEHRNKFDIKSAMMPIVDFARVYALKHGIAETNTMERLFLLRKKEVLTPESYTEMNQSYSFLMQLRFARQITAVLEENTEPDNYINPDSLSPLEQTLLKEIFKRLEQFQGKLRFDFVG